MGTLRFGDAVVDLLDQFLRVGSLLEDRDIRVAGGIDAELMSDGFEELEGLGVFLLGEQIDLEIEMAAPLIEAIFLSTFIMISGNR